MESRDTGIQGRRRNSYRTEGELTLRRMLTNFNAKDLQQPRRFPSEVLLATPAVLIPLAPAASHQNRPWSEMSLEFAQFRDAMRAHVLFARVHLQGEERE